jgi:class 3 adenylate cyclase
VRPQSVQPRTLAGRGRRRHGSGWGRGCAERLKAHLRELIEPKIAEHRGRIVKNTGDGFLAEFASVVDAVRCAVEMQRGMAERNEAVPTAERIEFRIGVNLGDVIAEEHDIFGDGVNVAARLEALIGAGRQDGLWRRVRTAPTNSRSRAAPLQTLYVQVDNVDAHCARARAAAAVIAEEPADQEYGDRRYAAEDPEGHRWYFAQPLRKTEDRIVWACT